MMSLCTECIAYISNINRNRQGKQQLRPANVYGPCNDYNQFTDAENAAFKKQTTLNGQTVLCGSAVACALCIYGKFTSQNFVTNANIQMVATKRSETYKIYRLNLKLSMGIICIFFVDRIATHRDMCMRFFGQLVFGQLMFKRFLFFLLSKSKLSR